MPSVRGFYTRDNKVRPILGKQTTMSSFLSVTENEARKSLLRQIQKPVPPQPRPVDLDFPHEFTREEQDYYRRLIDDWDYFRVDELADRLGYARRRIEGTRLRPGNLEYQVPMLAAQALIQRRLRSLPDSELKNVVEYYVRSSHLDRVNEGDKEQLKLINDEYKRRGLPPLEFPVKPVLITLAGQPFDRIGHAFGNDGYSTFEYYNDGTIHATYMGKFIDFFTEPGRLREAQEYFRDKKRLRPGPMYRSW